MLLSSERTFANVTHDATWDGVGIDPNTLLDALIRNEIAVQEDLQRRGCWVSIEEAEKCYLEIKAMSEGRT